MVDGRLLPQSIALSPAATGLELAGSALEDRGVILCSKPERLFSVIERSLP